MKEQNNIKSFESTLKEKTSGFELRPSEKVWASVKDTLSKDRRSKWLSVWSIALIGLTLLGSSGIIYFLAFDHSNKIHSQLTDLRKQTVEQKLTTGDSRSKMADNNSSIQSSSAVVRSQSNHFPPVVEATDNRENEVNSAYINADVNFYPEQVFAMSLASAIRMQFNPLQEVKTFSVKLPAPTRPETTLFQKQLSTGFCYLSCNNIHWAVESFVNPMISYRSFSGLPGLAIPDSIEEFRNETDKSSFGIKAGAAIVAQITRHFALGIAGSSLHFSEEMMVTSQSYIDNTNTGYNANLPTLGQSNLVNVAQTVPGDGEYVTNRFRFLEVSLNANIEMMRFGRHHLESNLGIGYAKLNQIISPYYGSEPVVSPSAAEDLLQIEITEQASDFRQHHITTSAGMRYRMDLNEHLGYFGGVQFQYLATNLFMRDYDYVQHPYGLGFSAGLRWQF